MKIVVAMATAAALTVLATPANADPDPDPNLPNMAANYCPGGRDDAPPFIYRCVGTKYPDGSYWRDNRYNSARYSPDNVYGPGLRCVMDYPRTHGSVTLAAPPGGCNGAV